MTGTPLFANGKKFRPGGWGTQEAEAEASWELASPIESQRGDNLRNLARWHHLAMTEIRTVAMLKRKREEIVGIIRVVLSNSEPLMGPA